MKDEMIIRIKEAFASGPKMVFFVGAGISVPSGVKNFQEFNKQVIRLITDGKLLSSEYDLLSKEIRPEVMLQIGIHELGLEVIESLEMLLGYKPKFNHFFLAEALRQGNWIFTTNQENLIEDACNKKRVKFKRCYIDSHFEEFEQHLSNVKNIPGGYIYKLHGTIEDNKRSKERFESVRIALEQVGQGLTDYSEKVFKYFLENYDFCFMGYSCQDDFSVYPVLLNTKGDKTIFWFQYTEGGIKSITKEEIEKEIKREEGKKPWRGEKTNWGIVNVNRFLLKRSNFFKFVGDSSEFIKNKLCPSLGINIVNPIVKDTKEYEYSSFAQWSKNIEEFRRIMFTGRLFEQVGEWEKALRYYEKSEKIAKGEENKMKELMAKQRLADLLYKQTELKKEKEAIEIYKECIDISNELRDEIGSTNLKFDILNIERRLGKYPEQPEKLANEVKKELKLLKDKDKRGYARCLNVLGLANLRGSEVDIERGLKHCNESKEIKEKLGDKDGVAESENAIGLLLIAQGRLLAKQDRMLAKENFNKAVKHLEKAIDIRKKYGFFRGCAMHYRNIGDAYTELMKLAQDEEERQHHFQKAEGGYEESVNFLTLFKPRAPLGEVLNWQQRRARLLSDFSKLISNTKQKKRYIFKIISVYKEGLNLPKDQEMLQEIKHKEKEYKTARSILEETKKSCEEMSLALEAEEIDKLLKELWQDN